MPAHSAAARRLDPLSVLGELLITLGVIVGLFAVYEVWWTNVEAKQEQQAAEDRLRQQWSDENPRPLTVPQDGSAIARLYIPSFGSDFSFAVVEGVTQADLARGPGHYPDTAQAGEPGNFALAGHRVGRGAPFNDLGLLHSCDAIVVETAGSWNVYRVLPIDTPAQQAGQVAAGCLPQPAAEAATSGAYADVNGRSITNPQDVEVVNPVPGQPRSAAQPGDLPLLTLTTCHPQFSNRERMIVHAVLARHDLKSPGYVPPELTGGA
ncbi:class E sortase [Corynebacterium heidelbergense]|uniref:Class E sortase n=1 Tax=Corynebacterium heidelbergense TaxID=2055947 RepID=A0A364VCQ5_9CORY|nr:class E sortase [Corynebacterium heidelbergense]RAV34442.1 class E sortase [Corynebacterium heidelbergense]WCZ37546.1 Sortase family protein [Corynebacterium heidelbergense]